MLKGGRVVCLCRSGAKVTLFEAEPTCGGHTLTDSTGQWPVDLGFQVRGFSLVPGLMTLARRSNLGVHIPSNN